MTRTAAAVLDPEIHEMCAQKYGIGTLLFLHAVQYCFLNLFGGWRDAVMLLSSCQEIQAISSCRKHKYSKPSTFNVTPTLSILSKLGLLDPFQSLHILYSCKLSNYKPKLP